MAIVNKDVDQRSTCQSLVLNTIVLQMRHSPLNREHVVPHDPNLHLEAMSSIRFVYVGNKPGIRPNTTLTQQVELNWPFLRTRQWNF